MHVSYLCGRREVPPQGLADGENGKCGRNAKRGTDGTIEELPGRTQITCETGEAVIIQTPSGDGYGDFDKK